ncbi:hypothetical protein FS749_015830 [Ceratobasidium sp. UAMH 11750]|nr:hypothetical protein FS749_015830 [Ceratobasidium sp. UAMH 11750]
MPRLLLTPNRSKHREPSSPLEDSSPVSPIPRKHRLGLPLPPTPGAENHSWHGGMGVNSESIRKTRTLPRMFPDAAKGKGCPREHTWGPSTHKLKGTGRPAGGIFVDPGSTAIPIPKQVPSADSTSPFVLQTAALSAPKDFIAPAFSLSAFSPPPTSSPFKVKPRRTGPGDKKRDVPANCDELAGPQTSSKARTACVGSAAECGRAPWRQLAGRLCELLGCVEPVEWALKKKYKAKDPNAIADESILEQGLDLEEDGGMPRTRARTMSFQRGNFPKDNDLVMPQFGPGTARAWPGIKDSDEQDLNPEIFNRMVSHTSFSIDGTGAGAGADGGMPDTPVKKGVFGTSGVGIGGEPIGMGGARGWMTTLPDRGGKAFGGRNAPRPSLPIRFPELFPDSPDDSPAVGRSKLPTIDSNESPTMHQFWNPGGPDESPSLHLRRRSGETPSLPRRKSAGGDILLNLGVRKQKTADSPKRPQLGGQKGSYGSLGLGRPGGRKREPIPKFSFEESRRTS